MVSFNDIIANKTKNIIPDVAEVILFAEDCMSVLIKFLLKTS